MKHVLITGATSFIGRHLTARLVEDGAEVWAVVRPGSHIENCRVIPLDICDIEALATQKLPPMDAFYHLAWDGVRGDARDDLGKQQENYKTGLCAIKTCAAMGIPAFIGAGSQAEYGETAYGRAKAQLFADGAGLCRENNIRFVWPRIFSVYGAGDFSETLIMTALQKMLANEPIDLGACSQLWDYLNVKDAAAALFLLGDKGEGMFHLAYGESRPLKEFLLEMKAIAHSKSPLHFGSLAQGGKSADLVANISALRALGWRPQVSFQKGIAELLERLKTT